MDTLLKNTQDRLIEKATSLKYVDEDWGQLNFDNPPVKFPCALIDVSSGTFTNQLKFVQMGLVQVVVSIADLKLSNSSGAAPAGQKANAFKIWEVVKEAYLALQGWAGSKHYSRLIRKSIRKRQLSNGVRVYEVIFDTEIYDYSAEPEKLTVPIEPSATIGQTSTTG